MIIYCITCFFNGKKYYGQTTKTLEKRWSGHLYSAYKRNSKMHLHNAIRKYGKENFSIEEIERIFSKKEADEREIYYINKNNTINEGYNMTKGGEGSPGRKDSEETKAKRKTSFKVTMFNGFSEEHKRKLSKARKQHSGPNKGKEFSEEHRENLRKARVGKTPNKGNNHSEETKMKISLTKARNKITKTGGVL